MNELRDRIFSVDEQSFEAVAKELFLFQCENNALYRSYADRIGCNVLAVNHLADIPFLPVSFFKTHKVTTTRFEPDVIFESSGTTGTINSKHLVKDAGIYVESFRKAFTRFYGPVKDFCVLGLLPSYLERGHSSLIFMVNDLIRESGHPQSGFYLNNFEELSRTLDAVEAAGQKTLLIGVTYALIDFAARFPKQLQHTLIMETGGMKGRRRELIRAEVHDLLKSGLGVSRIHSEYGMTELLSQAYSKENGLFNTPPWMKVVLREEEDPLSVLTAPARGVLNIIDLANIYSCSFIATDDLGVVHPDGSFEILGRRDNSDIRGCSLLAL
ncbi:acyl transferase [Niabella ginsenosidivorans]|uniref:Acyl transferase n=1 Tax=Niabella ginsenosidivorans TaxID=1176587 RepID=A0A1A9I3Q5_9BACT|nr:acyl transferase [Niabella ginsenosidivorans]ANH82256.1 acyl transferase [Niabella ginsenosidivorans]